MTIENDNFSFKRYQNDLKEIHNRIDRANGRIEEVRGEVETIEDKLDERFYELKISNGGLHTKLDTVVANAQKAEDRAGKQTDRAQGQLWAMIMLMLTIVVGAFINAFFL